MKNKKKYLLIILLVLVQFSFGQNFENILEKAERGDAEAEYEIGKIYEFGYNGMSKDLNKAIYWYEKSATQNIQGAQYRLGLIYNEGKGVLIDKEKAIFWFKKNAENGNSNTQIILALMYADDDDGIEQDDEQAFYWYKKFAEQELQEAAEERRVDGELRKFHNVYLPTVLFLVGNYYHYGFGVIIDKKEAFYWYKKSAEFGNPIAQLELGKMYFNGEGEPADKAKAAFWVKKAYENDNEEAKETWDKYELWKY